MIAAYDVGRPGIEAMAAANRQDEYHRHSYMLYAQHVNAGHQGARAVPMSIPQVSASVAASHGKPCGNSASGAARVVLYPTTVPGGGRAALSRIRDSDRHERAARLCNCGHRWVERCGQDLAEPSAQRRRICISRSGNGTQPKGTPMRILALAVCLLTTTAHANAAECVGDCNGNGIVEIGELVTLVTIALGDADASACPNGIAAADIHQVGIAVLVQAVNRALDGCAPVSTDTPTQAPTDTFSSTRTPSLTSTATFTAMGTQTTTSMATPTDTVTLTASPTPPLPRFVDNGDGTVSDTQTGLMWEKKDQGGGLHDENVAFSWAADCSAVNFCQPDAAAAAACTAATNFAAGCAQCTGSQTCDTGGVRTIWQWLNDLNAGKFAGHSDWRIPTVGKNGSQPELETILDSMFPVAGCNAPPYPPCVWSIFDTACRAGCTVTDCSCTRSYPYWSATTFASGEYLPGAWYVNFSDRDVEFAEAGLLDRVFVRAVRGGFTPTQTPTAMGTQMATPTVTVTPTTSPTTPPTSTQTQTRTVTATETVTPTAPTPTPRSTRTETPTPDNPTPTPGAACRGDCNLDGRISISELIVEVIDDLDGGASCNADANGDGVIDVSEIMTGVAVALGRFPCVTSPFPRLEVACDDGAVVVSSSSPPTPIPGEAIISVGTADAMPGAQTKLSVTLRNSIGLSIAGIQNDIAFDPEAPISATGGTCAVYGSCCTSNADCTTAGDICIPAVPPIPGCCVNPAIVKSGTTFSFEPAGCTGTNCTGIRAIVLSLDNLKVIPDGSLLYTCLVDVASGAPDGQYALPCSNAIAGSVPSPTATASQTPTGPTLTSTPRSTVGRTLGPTPTKTPTPAP